MENSTRPRKRKCGTSSRQTARRVNEAQDDDGAAISDSDMFSDEEEGGIRVGNIYIPPPTPEPTQEYLNRTGPRLVISHIENINFKSYANRVIVGPFHTSFSCIIGPNGSGKSNVIDAMLFVFGYRATKIRSKKVSVLIHKSEKYPNNDSCTVAVHFLQIIDKENVTFEEVPDSKFVISRTAFKDNSSYYMINNKRVPFKEVALQLRRHGIDLVHNRFLILQGEVEQISLMKPKGLTEHETGMLEYIEDIIGTTKYKEPIRKLSNKVALLSEQSFDEHARLRTVESERDSLRAPMENAVNFLKTENTIALLTSKKYQLAMYNINKDVERHNVSKEQIELELGDLKGQLEGLGSEQAEHESVMNALSKEVDGLNKKYEELSSIKKKADKKNAALTEELSNLKTNSEKIVGNLKAEESKLANLLKVPEKNMKEIEKIEKEYEMLNKEKEDSEAALQEVMANVQLQTQKHQLEKEKLQAEQIKLKEEYNSALSAYKLLKDQYDILVSNEQNEKAKLEERENALKSVSESLKTRKKEQQNLEKEIPEKEAVLKQSEIEIPALKEREKTLASKIRNCAGKLDDYRCQMFANHSNNRVLNFLMKQKEEGKIPGILGRLGDLGAIDKEYDVAISTACGPLDYIVIEDSRNVELCLRALKVHDVGRASFIALDKMEHLRSKCNTPMQTPENVPRLFDLVRVQDERVLTAFYYSLRDTLAAKDLDQATRIAYGAVRHRVVTLAGEIIEPSGTMSGGGNAVSRGRMGQSVAVVTDKNPEDMTRLEKSIADMEGELTSVREKLGSLEKVVMEYSPQIRSMKNSVNKMAVEIKDLLTREPILIEQVRSQKEKVKQTVTDPKKLQELTAKIDNAQKVLDKSNNAVKTIDEKVKKVHTKIMEISSGARKEAQGRLDEVNSKLENNKKRATKLQVAINTSQRDVAKTRERIKRMETELAEADTKKIQLKENKEKVLEDSELAEKMTVEAKEKLSEKQAVLHRRQQEFGEFSQNSNKLKADIIKLERKLDSVNTIIAETKKDEPFIKAKLKKLTLNKIPTFDEDKNSPSDISEFVTFPVEELAKISNSDINSRLQREEEYLKTLNPDLRAIEDYTQKIKQCTLKEADCKKIDDSLDEFKRWYNETRERRTTEFLRGFRIIAKKLKDMYRVITLGGDAELELADSLDPFTEGITFSVRPAKKTWKNISKLSGGEKTLSSLALVFALHYYKPTPLYVMDEIDAALDFKNVYIIGDYIKKRTKNAQFIVISLRTNMFELAYRLVGIFKQNNCTSSVTIEPEKIFKRVDALRKEMGYICSEDEEDMENNPNLANVPENNRNSTNVLGIREEQSRNSFSFHLVNEFEVQPAAIHPLLSQTDEDSS